jgi:hypothetical protein
MAGLLDTGRAALLTLWLAAACGSAVAQQEVRGVLAGHAALAFDSTVQAPADAGPLFATAGKFSDGNRQRNETLGAIQASTFVGDPKMPRASGGALPIRGQSVQGISALVSLGGDEFLAMSDNGFGSKLNSADALLMVHRVRMDWASGRAARLDTVFLRDPDKKVPFLIQNEATAERYLTGVDFDIESMQRIGDEWWFGDEFGPYLLRTDTRGRVLSVIETVVEGKAYRGPDHYLKGRLPNLPGVESFEVRRSGGFEPMAQSPDGTRLYPMFEWPLVDPETRALEQHQGRNFTRILEFDRVRQVYTGRQWKYRFEENGNVASDMQLLDARTGLVIERDDASEGLAPACPGAARTDCFTHPARFKRIYKIDLAQQDADGFVRKIAYIDLRRLDNPNRLARIGPNEAEFGMPHLGPEALAIVDGQHIVVANDNNFPYSSGRKIGQPDDNEFVRIDIRALLDAR